MILNNCNCFGYAYRLTAFALKTFNNAVQKNRIPIEMDTLADTLDWIISHQNATGAFSEPDKGRVYHVEMQVSSKPSDAFVL